MHSWSTGAPWCPQYLPGLRPSRLQRGRPAQERRKNQTWTVSAQRCSASRCLPEPHSWRIDLDQGWEVNEKGGGGGRVPNWVGTLRVMRRVFVRVVSGAVGAELVVHVLLESISCRYRLLHMPHHDKVSNKSLLVPFSDSHWLRRSSVLISSGAPRRRC